MKLLLYRGRCASKTVNGIKFTQNIRTANVSDEVAGKFVGLSDFVIYELKKTDIIKEDKKEDKSTKEDDAVEEDDSVEEVDEAKVKKFMKLNLDTLREMCEAKELDSTGTKQELATRLSSK